MPSRKPPPDDNAEALFQRVLGQLRAAGYAVGDAAMRGGQRMADAMQRGAGFATQTVEDALSGAKDAQLFFRVPSGLRSNLKALAAHEDRKMEELLTEALVLKPGRVDDGGKNFCIVDAAMNDMVRPAMYEAWLAIVPCHQRAEPPLTWDVVGPVCESGDWLGRDRALAVQTGDVLAVLSAGAYGMAMASNYNSRGRPAELLIDRGEALLVRTRETVEALHALERLPGA